MVKVFSKLLYILDESKFELVTLLLASVFASALEAIGIGLIGPFLRLTMDPGMIQGVAILNWLYNWLPFKSTNHFIAFVGFAIIVIFCVKSVAFFFMKSYIYNFGFRQKGRISQKLMRTYLTVPYTFFFKRNTSSVIRNIIVETDKFSYQVLIGSLEAAANLLLVVIIIAVLARTDVIFLGIASLILLPTIGSFYLLRKKFSNWGQIAADSRNEIIRIINHSLGGLKETRIIGCEEYFEEQMNEKIKNYVRAESLFHSTQLIPRVAIETILVLFLILIVCVYQLFFQQDIQKLLPVLSVFAIASIRLIPATSHFIGSVNYVQVATYSMDLIYLDLLEAEQEKNKQLRSSLQKVKDNNRLTHSSNANPSFYFEKLVDLKHLAYSYPNNDSPALSDISLNLKKGESIALIGKSGAGKTTLVDIILGLLQPDNGDIYVDGVSIYEDIRSWQNLIGYIPQTIFLMDDTLERNIAFGIKDELIDQQLLNQAIQAAQLKDLLDELPDGLNTVVGERGIRLSGGQRQRIGIARALYHKKEILVLDEATSALDNETESLVTEAIQSLSASKTMIIIAHRLSTIKHCDRVYVLEKGQVVKCGSYEDIVLKEKAYS